ncbi:MAG: hypothetical protein [Podoviridae sp. ctbj_2]|nr:MAG: hypothetical protein [Podoviridae sp. ctbj_2]
MADFSIQATNLAGPQLAGSAPVNPVQSRRQGPIIPGELLKLGVQVGADAASAYASNQTAGALGAYQKQLAGVASALSGGHITEREALMRTQNISTQFSSNYADGSGDFIKGMASIRKDMFSTTSLQFAAEEQEDTRAAKKEARSDAIKKGLLNPFSAGYSPQMEASATELSMSMQRAEDEWGRQQRMASEGRAQESHSWAGDANYRANTDFVNKEAAKNAVSDVRVKAMGYLNSSIDDLSKQVTSGAVDYPTAQLSLTRITSEMSAKVQELLIDNPAAAKVVSDQISALQKAADDNMNPQKRSESTAAAYNEMLTRTKLALVTDDPELQVLAATNAMVPNLPISSVVGNKAITTAFRAANEGRYSGLILGNDTTNQRVLFSGVQATVNKAQSGVSGGVPEKQMTDAASMTNMFMREAAKVSPGDPTSLRTFTQFMASPEAGKLVESGKLDKQTAAQAASALANTHQRDVLMNVTPRLNMPLGAAVMENGESVQPTLANVADFEMRGGELVLTDKPSRQMYAAPQLIRARAQEVRDVMKEINTLIRAGAHMEGTTDYAAYWEKNKHLIMPDFFIAPEREAEAKAQGYLGGNRRNPANWRKPDNGGNASNE